MCRRSSASNRRSRQGLPYDPRSLWLHGRAECLRALAQCRVGGFRFNLMETSFFIGREKLRPRPRRARLLALARPALHLDVQQHARRDRILPHPGEPRRRARRPDRNLIAPRKASIQRRVSQKLYRVWFCASDGLGAGRGRRLCRSPVLALPRGGVAQGGAGRLVASAGRRLRHPTNCSREAMRLRPVAKHGKSRHDCACRFCW